MDDLDTATAQPGGTRWRETTAAGSGDDGGDDWSNSTAAGHAKGPASRAEPPREFDGADDAPCDSDGFSSATPDSDWEESLIHPPGGGDTTTFETSGGRQFTATSTACKFVVRNKDGKTIDLADAPPELREQIERMLRAAGKPGAGGMSAMFVSNGRGGANSRIQITRSDGTRDSYSSMDEVPEADRRLIEGIRGGDLDGDGRMDVPSLAQAVANFRSGEKPLKRHGRTNGRPGFSWWTLLFAMACGAIAYFVRR